LKKFGPPSVETGFVFPENLSIVHPSKVEARGDFLGHGVFEQSHQAELKNQNHRSLPTPALTAWRHCAQRILCPFALDYPPPEPMEKTSFSVAKRKDFGQDFSQPPQELRFREAQVPLRFFSEPGARDPHGILPYKPEQQE
jgi:hypothetical protein